MPPSSVCAVDWGPALPTPAGRLAMGAGSALAWGLAGWSTGSPEGGAGRQAVSATARIVNRQDAGTKRGGPGNTSGVREVPDDADLRVERGGAVEVLGVDEDRVRVGEVRGEDVAVLGLVVEGGDDGADAGEPGRLVALELG